MNSIGVAVDALERTIRRNRRLTPSEEAAAFEALWSEETRLRYSTLGPLLIPWLFKRYPFTEPSAARP